MRTVNLPRCVIHLGEVRQLERLVCALKDHAATLYLLVTLLNRLVSELFYFLHLVTMEAYIVIELVLVLIIHKVITTLTISHC